MPEDFDALSAHALLLEAIDESDLQKAQSIIKLIPTGELGKKDSNGLTALHHAAQKGSVAILKNLIDKVPQKNLAIRDSEGRTALHHATRCSDETSMKACTVALIHAMRPADLHIEDNLKSKAFFIPTINPLRFARSKRLENFILTHMIIREAEVKKLEPVEFINFVSSHKNKDRISDQVMQEYLYKPFDQKKQTDHVIIEIPGVDHPRAQHTYVDIPATTRMDVILREGNSKQKEYVLQERFVMPYDKQTALKRKYDKDKNQGPSF